jgi:hypothetical protein
MPEEDIEAAVSATLARLERNPRTPETAGLRALLRAACEGHPPARL